MNSKLKYVLMAIPIIASSLVGLVLPTGADSPPSATLLWTTQVSQVYGISQITLTTSGNYHDPTAIALIQTTRPDAIILSLATGAVLYTNNAYQPATHVATPVTQVANAHVVAYLTGCKPNTTKGMSTPSIVIYTSKNQLLTIPLDHTSSPCPTTLAIGSNGPDFLIVGDNRGNISLYILDNVD